VKSIAGIKVKLQETMKPNISYKTRNILGVDRVEDHHLTSHHHRHIIIIIIIMHKKLSIYKCLKNRQW